MRFVLLIRGEFLGDGPEDLGATLMGSMLRKLWAQSQKPDAIIFYNTGVKLLLPTSTVIDALAGLAAQGVDIVACGTCATYFQLKTTPVGRISDMQEIVTLLTEAERVVTV